MDIKNFLSKVCNEIKYKPARQSISEELELHMQELKGNYIESGIDENEAEEKAVSQMGVAEEIGKKLNKIHRPKLDWKLLVLVTILLGFGLFIASLKQTELNNSYVGHTVLYIIIGVAIGIAVYFFDYKKIKKCSNIIYVIATVILLFQFVDGIVIRMQGVRYIRIFNITFMPCIVAVPLYIIAFIGFITDYNSENKKKFNFEIVEGYINVNTKFIKIMILSIFSLFFVMETPSIANAVILFFSYLTIGTVKIIKTDKHKIKKLSIIYGLILCAVLFVTIVSATSIEEKIMASFNPEIDPYGIGYAGMMQKEVLNNAKLIGEADTPVVSGEDYLINKDSNFTFIYLVGKTGILVSVLLVITIILTAVKFILSSKKVKDMYGKFIIIGLGFLIIFQSIASVLINVNMGIRLDINIPFVTYGGVHLIINIISVALILSVYRRKDLN